MIARNQTSPLPVTSFSEFLREHLEAHPKITDQMIADRLSIPDVRAIPMMRDGLIKVPLEKLVHLANVLDVDPVYLTRLWLLDEQADKASAATEMIDRFVSRNEFELIQVYRSAVGDRDVKIPDEILAHVGTLIAGAMPTPT